MVSLDNIEGKVKNEIHKEEKIIYKEEKELVEKFKNKLKTKSNKELNEIYDNNENLEDFEMKLIDKEMNRRGI